jgi:hypothetical protein
MIIKKDKLKVIIPLSVIFGFFTAVVFLSNWDFFWRRSLTIRGLIIVGIIFTGSVIFYISVQKGRMILEKRKPRDIWIYVVICSIIVVYALVFISPYIKLPPLPITEHILDISSTNMKNDKSISDDIGILELKIDGNVLPLSSSVVSGDWEQIDKSIYLRKNANARFIFPAKLNTIINILFEKGPSAGIVNIRYDNQQSETIDLFSNESELMIMSFENKPPILVFILYLSEITVIFWLVFCIIIFSSIFKIYPKSGIFSKFEIRALLCFIIITLFTICQTEINLGFTKIEGGWNYFLGKVGSIPAYGDVSWYVPSTGKRNNINTCLEVLKNVPGKDQVLFINGFSAIEPCLFSPLLPRDKIVHHYEAVVYKEPYFRTLMYGEPDAAYEIYKELGINYFFFRKDDLIFSNLGYSHALEPKFLEKYFDVFTDTKEFYILTWRGEGRYPVSKDLSKQIEILYENGKIHKINNNNTWWRGKVSLDNWLNELDEGN